MNEISGWFPLCYRKIFTPLPPTPTETLLSLPSLFLSPLSVPFYRWVNWEALGKLIACPKQEGSGAELTAFSASQRKWRAPGYLVFVSGIEGDLSHFLITFTHQLHGARGQFDALEQSRFGGIPSHIPL